MRLQNTLLLLLGAAANGVWALNETKAVGDGTPRRYIVELKSRAQCKKFTSETKKISGLRIVNRFDSDIFPGVTVECDHDCNADSVRETLEASDNDPVVASVYKSRTMKMLPTIEGESYSNDAAAANYSVHGSTGVEQLHAAGIVGEGATVAIVDSGIQYTHPALGGGIGPNYTVIGGHDLVGDNWPDEPAKPDDDPMDSFGHGTHVAGIIAGKSEKFTGVAPGAKLLSFKVFATTGYSNEETVILGFLEAFESGADIISASVGETSGFTTNALAVVASRIVDKGVPVVFAAGNDGQDGPFLMSNGASGEHVLTVASGEPGAYPAQAFSAQFNAAGQSNKTKVAYAPSTDSFPESIKGWPIVPITLNASVTDDACSTLPSGTGNLTGSIALARLGGCTVSTKHANIAAFGAKYILFYNDDGPFRPLQSTFESGLIAAIEERAGKAIIETIIDGGNVTATFDIDPAETVSIISPGRSKPALYTTWGSTYDLALKPDVAAPGSKILSTYPTNEYRVLSGTSMATPYIAGVLALWVGKYGGRAEHADDPSWAKKLMARVMTTAEAMPWADWATTDTDYGFWAPSTQVGAGFIDARKLFNQTTQLSFEGRKFELNDTAHFVGTHSVDITNDGEEAVTYKFSVQDAGGYESYIPSIPGNPQTFVPGFKLYADIDPLKMVPDVSLPEDLTIGPGETKTAEFTFKEPEGLNATVIPVYSGRILINGTNGDELAIPYFGVASDLQKSIESVWYTGLNYPFISSTSSDVRIDVKSNFTFNLTRVEQDFPKLFTEFAWGTRELRWDIFEANYTETAWSYPPTVGKNGFVGSATSWNGTLGSSWFDPETNSEEDIFPFPIYDQARDRQAIYYWLGRFANGSDILPGEYQFRVAGLKPFGEASKSEDWDIFKTPKVTVLPL